MAGAYAPFAAALTAVTLLLPPGCEPTPSTEVCTGRTERGDVPADRFPGADCTGVPDGITLTDHPGGRLEQDGATYDSINFTGEICVAADNVTITRSRINGVLTVANAYGFYGCDIPGGAQNVTLIDVEINAQTDAWAAIEGGIFSPGIYCLRCDLHHAGAGIGGGHYALVDTYVHDLLGHGTDPCCWTHNDGIQVGGAGGGVVVLHSNIDSVYAPESTGGGMSCSICLYTHTDGGFVWGPMNGVVISNTRIRAATAVWCAYGGGSNEQDPTNIRYIDNTFVRESASGTCGYDGPLALWEDNAGNVWTGNHYDDGTPIP